jgi:WD40 repeat protein/serine/threonine protein kinase
MPDAAPRKIDTPRDAVTPPEIPDYTLLRRIGRGSYGDVWLARSVTGVFRVIKVVQRSRFDDDRPYLRELEGISRFQAAVSGRPRQLALLHVGRNDDAGYFYYVMEPADDAESGSAIDPDRYVPLTLREMVKRRGRLPAAECVQFALELARGLAVLHGENLIHRDIKPSNVIFVQRVPKLADVGLVASADATLTGVGTPGYLPPEGPGSAAADVYSLGKVIYEMATGMDQSQYPRIPKELADHADAPLLREINGIILKACNPYPNERHASVQALERDLELIQAGRSLVFYEEFRKRSRAILLVTASLAILAGLAAALFVWRSEVLQRANSQSRRALYKSDISNAKLAKASGDLGTARAALLRQKPNEGEEDLRGLEWAILAHAVRGEGAPLEPIPDPVAISKIAVDATGRWIAASFIDDRVAVWDLRNGRIARVIDNAQVLGGFLTDGSIVVDEPDRRVRFEKPNENSPVWFETNRRLRQLLPDGRLCVISPNGDLVYQIIDPKSNSVGSEINVSSLFPGTELSDSEITSDGKTLLWAGYKEVGAIRERFLLAFDMPSRRLLWRIDPPRRIVWVRCSPDLKYAAINTGGLVPTIIDISNPNRQTFLEGHLSRVQEAVFSPNGDLIATGSADQTIRVWNVHDGTLTSTHRGMGRPCTAIAWLPNSDHVVAGDDSGEIQVFGFPPTVSQNALTGMYSDIHGDLVFDKTGKRAAITQSPNTIAIASTIELAQIDTLTNVFQPIRFSEDGTSLLAFSNDWSVVSVDLQTKRQSFLGNLLPKNFSIDSWAISKDQGRLAMTADGGHLAIINLQAMTCIRISNTNTLRTWGVTFSPDGDQVWTGAEDGTIEIRKSEDGRLVRQETSLPDGDIQAMALSTDEKWLAVSLFNDASVRVWDRTHKAWLKPWFAHRRFVQALLFTRDSSRLISGGVDGRVVFWRVPDFEEIASFEVAPLPKPTGDEGIATLRLTNGEEILGALTEDGRFQIWRGQ